MTPTSLGLSIDDLKDGFAQAVDADGTKLLVVRLGDDVRAVSRWCTHARTLMSEQDVAEDGLLECSLHGAVFDTTDGSQQLGPTCPSLPVYPTSITKDGSISVALDEAPPATPTTTTSPFGSWGSPRS